MFFYGFLFISQSCSNGGMPCGHCLVHATLNWGMVILTLYACVTVMQYTISCEVFETWLMSNVVLHYVNLLWTSLCCLAVTLIILSFLSKIWQYIKYTFKYHVFCNCDLLLCFQGQKRMSLCSFIFVMPA